MFSLLLARNFGPLADASIPLDPKGRTDIRARSRSGKTNLARALIFALFGTDEHGKALDPAFVGNGADRAEVRLTTGKGTVYGRTMTRTRSYSRLVAPAGQEPSRPGSDAEMAKLLPAQLTRDPQLVRCIVAPLVWRALAEGPGDGRAFRDLLSRLTPGGDLRAEVARLLKEAGHDLRDSDPADQKAAEVKRTFANTAKEQAAGRLAEARRAVEALGGDLPDAPSEEEIGDAGDVHAADLAWRQYDAALGRVEVVRQMRVAAQAALGGWQSRRDALGKRPVEDAEAMRAASVALVAAREADREARMAHARAQAALQAANASLATVEADTTDAEVAATTKTHRAAQEALAKLSAAGDICPTCNRAGWEEAKAAMDAAGVAVEEARKALADATKSAPKRKAGAMKAAQDAFTVASGANVRAAKAVDVAVAALTQAEEAHAALRGVADQARAWDAAKAALGHEPTIPTVPADLAAPTWPRPTPETIAKAADIEQRATAAKGAATERERATVEAAQRVTAAGGAEHLATVEAARAAALVEAYRAAPSALAKQQIAALGDLGPVTIALTDGGGVDVRVRGLPWMATSGGEQVEADLWLRLALRRAAGMGWLPVVIDDVVSWTEAWPEVTGPSVWLHAVAEDMTSSAGVAQAAK